MAICGRVHVSREASPGVDRTLTALSIGASRLQRRWSGPGIQLASCDDGALAAAPGRAVAFDGRLDNRADLRGRLDAQALERSDGAGAVLLAHDRWGDGYCDHVIGDYACAVWEEGRRRLVLTADPGGMRPVYYWLGADEILFASEQRGLWADPDVPKLIDEDQMAAWLTLLPREPQRSFFRDIFRVAPGHRLIWEGGRGRLERWWRPESLPALRLASPRDYEAILRETLDEAIRCRIDTDERIGCHLSGGLDSSAVTALAARQLAARGQRLTAFTAAPSHAVAAAPGRFSDEWPHAAALAALYPNIDHVRIANDDAPLRDAMAWREAGQDIPVLNPSNIVWVNGIDRAARDRRITVMLIGQMGNLTISYDGGNLPTARLRRGDILGAARASLALRGGSRLPWLSILNLWAEGVMPPGILRALRAGVGKGRPSLYDYSVINPHFARSTGIEDQALAMGGDLRNLHRDDTKALRLAALDRMGGAATMAAGSRRLFGIDTRDPSSDRRVIELCLTIPDEQFQLGGVRRSLIRRAMAGLVPTAILSERRKGQQSADWQVGFDAAREGIAEDIARMRNSPLASRCLDLDRMDRLLERWPTLHAAGDDVFFPYKLALSRALGAGRFIRRIEGGNG